MNKENNIEKKYRDVFNNDLSNESWAIPDDSLWQHIEEEITQEPKRSTWWPLLYFFTLMAAALIGYKLYSNNIALKERLGQKEKQLIECSSRKQDVGAVSPNISNEINQDISTLSPIATPQTTVQAEQSAPTHVNNFYKSPAFKEDESTVDAVLSSIVEKNIPNATKPKSKERIDISPIPNIPRFLANTKREIFPKDAEMPIENGLKEKSLPWQIGIHVARESAAERSVGNHESALSELIVGEHTDIGFATELTIGKFVNDHFLLLGGVGYSKQRFHTNYGIELGYDTNREMHQGDIGTLDFEHSLPSFTGDMNTSLILSRSLQDQVTTGEIVQLDFHTSTAIHQLRFPLGVRWYSQADKSGFTIQGGVVPAYVLSTKSGVDNVVSHHDHVSYTHADATHDEKGFETLNISAHIGAGYYHNIGKNTSIGLDINYLRQLDAMYQNKDFKSSFDIFSMSIGMTSTF